jgi:hypothetical protein
MHGWGGRGNWQEAIIAEIMAWQTSDDVTMTPALRHVT